MLDDQQKEPRPLVVETGRIIAYRIFDIADAIDLDKVLRTSPDGRGRRLSLSRDGAKSLVLSAPPVDVALGSPEIHLSSAKAPMKAKAQARLFDYGAVSVAMELPIEPGTHLESIIPLCDEIYESEHLDEIARRELDVMLHRLDARALERAHDWEKIETYTVIFVEALEGRPPAREVLAWPLLAKLVVGEAGDKPLSAEQIADVLRQTHSYFEDDLVVIDWNSAFVLDPSGSRDIPDILELATSQLLELRYYDNLFDRELARIYDDLARARRIPFPLRSPYRRLARDVLRRIVELTELTERVDNALKIIGDFYLAKVYEGALRRFRIPAWRSSIDGKQALVAQAYDLIKGEVDVRRSTVLELVVIVLIFAELANTMLRH